MILFFAFFEHSPHAAGIDRLNRSMAERETGIQKGSLWIIFLMQIINSKNNEQNPIFIQNTDWCVIVK